MFECIKLYRVDNVKCKWEKIMEGNEWDNACEQLKALLCLERERVGKTVIERGKLMIYE